MRGSDGDGRGDGDGDGEDMAGTGSAAGLGPAPRRGEPAMPGTETVGIADAADALNAEPAHLN